MQQATILPALHRRITRGPNLGLLLLVGCLFAMFRIGFGPPEPRLAELALPFVLLFAHLALAPLPWQWTGNDAPRPGLGRGFLQSLAFSLVWVALILYLMNSLGPHPGPDGPRPMPPMGPPHPGFHGHPGLRGFGDLGAGLVNVAFAIVFGWVFAEMEATQRREQDMASLLRQSQSRALQNQLEPHVLYNALNGLAELVHDDPLAAEEMIARLADLYRMLSQHGAADSQPLARERALVETYLAMEEMRLGERLRVSWDWPAWADPLPLPPLLLQPLVENAIKHGISPCAEGGELRISLGRAEGALVLVVANTGRPLLLAGAPDGLGLTNLRARLALWQEHQARFTLEQAQGWTVARIRWTEAQS